MGVEDDRESHAIIGAAFAVHSSLGPGFLEAVYQEALAHEFAKRGISYEREARLQIWYDGQALSTPYRVDFLVAGRYVVELKAMVLIGRVEEAQVAHYLKAARRETGLLLNFGTTSLQVRRLTYRDRPLHAPEVEDVLPG